MCVNSTPTHTPSPILPENSRIFKDFSCTLRTAEHLHMPLRAAYSVCFFVFKVIELKAVVLTLFISKSNFSYFPETLSRSIVLLRSLYPLSALSYMHLCFLTSSARRPSFLKLYALVLITL